MQEIEKKRAIIETLESQAEGKYYDEIGPVYVPKALPGEEIEGEIYFRRGKQRALRIEKILKASSDRVEASCPHYARCGGCSLMHLTENSYKSFKVDYLIKTLQQRGITLDKNLAGFWSEPGSRRRVSISYRHERPGMKLGFFAPHSDFLVNIDTCLLLTPRLNQLIDPLRNLLIKIIPLRAEGFIHLTDTDGKVDLSWSPHQFKGKDLTNELWQIWAQFAHDHDLGRVTRAAKELIIEREKPFVNFSGTDIPFPAASFLQPSKQSEQAMISKICSWIEEIKSKQNLKLADLFCGLGTFSFPIAQYGALTSYDSDGPAIDSLEKTVGSRWTIGKRDLFTDPMTSEELSTFDIVLLDPPRAGAYEQVLQLAESSVPDIMMISCDISTCARDLSVLINAGYEIKEAYLVDQFPYTSHIESMFWLKKI